MEARNFFHAVGLANVTAAEQPQDEEWNANINFHGYRITVGVYPVSQGELGQLITLWETSQGRHRYLGQVCHKGYVYINCGNIEDVAELNRNKIPWKVVDANDFPIPFSYTTEELLKM